MGTDRWPVDFRYISSRLVRQIVQQDEASRSRWCLSTTFRLPGAVIRPEKRPLRYDNKFALCREATEAVRDNTSTIAQGWGDYIRAELDIEMGLLTVFMGWKSKTHVQIAAMKAEVTDPDQGRMLVALFGSASNYTGRKSLDDGLAEIPSDVDGLYGILERTREPGEPEIDDHYLDRDIGHSPSSRADTAIKLLRDCFSGFRTEYCDVLIKTFCIVNEGTKPYGRVILGAPVWVATPEPKPMTDLK